LDILEDSFTLLFDINVDIARNRTSERKQHTIEGTVRNHFDVRLQETARRYYLQEIKCLANHNHIIDSNPSLDDVQKEIIVALHKYFG
jgi:thymidylate kinase